MECSPPEAAATSLYETPHSCMAQNTHTHTGTPKHSAHNKVVSTETVKVVLLWQPGEVLGVSGLRGPWTHQATSQAGSLHFLLMLFEQFSMRPAD